MKLLIILVVLTSLGFSTSNNQLNQWKRMYQQDLSFLNRGGTITGTYYDKGRKTYTVTEQSCTIAIAKLDARIEYQNTARR